MKKIALMLCAVATLISCDNDDNSSTPNDVTVDFSFTHNWDGTPIANSDFETTTYTNEANTELKLSKLVYLVSDMTFTSATGDVYDAGGFNLVNAKTGANEFFTPDIQIPEGDYNVSFTFGFDDEDNDKAGGYPTLNTADGGWGVPAPLGGGYHFMRMEGTYVNSLGVTDNFQYHTVRANRHITFPPSGTPEELLDSSFTVDLGTITIGSNTNIEVAMDVSEWFKNPNTWDLNTWYTVLMPNFEAQKDMSENGEAGVFAKGAVTQQ